MPLYCFTTENGQTIERMYPALGVPKRIRINGRWAHRDIAAEHSGFRDTPGAWPKMSTALGVHPAQHAEAVQNAESLGVPTRFVNDGISSRPVFTDRGHFNKYCEATGVYDMDGGYNAPRRRKDRGDF